MYLLVEEVAHRLGVGDLRASGSKARFWAMREPVVGGVDLAVDLGQLGAGQIGLQRPLVLRR